MITSTKLMNTVIHAGTTKVAITVIHAGTTTVAITVIIIIMIMGKVMITVTAAGTTTRKSLKTQEWACAKPKPAALPVSSI